MGLVKRITNVYECLWVYDGWAERSNPEDEPAQNARSATNHLSCSSKRIFLLQGRQAGTGGGLLDMA